MKKVLFCVTGLTPQVVTETLYALARQQKPWIPDEIHVLTTLRGREHARLTLFVEEGGWFHRLRREYSLPPICFNEDHLHLITDDDGLPLEDIRTDDDNRHLADAITRHVRRWCLDEDVALHVSLAGGRKTMSFFAGYVLSLFGRPQDRLSHVLVEPAPFESHPQFFYPTPYSSPIRDRNGQIMDRAHARVQLADVPFLRLQLALDKHILAGADTFEVLIERLQADLAGVRPVVIDMARQFVKVGDSVIGLSPINFMFYSWLAERHRNGLTPVEVPSSEDVEGDAELAAELIEWIERFGEPHRDFERSIVKLGRDGLSHAFVRDRKNQINRTFKEAMGLTAKPYQVESLRGQGRVTLMLDPALIHFESHHIVSSC